MPRRRNKTPSFNVSPGVKLSLPAACLLLVLLPLCPVYAQEEPTTVTLSQATDAAVGQGADSRILAKNLDIGREQYRLSVAQNSFSLSGSVGEKCDLRVWRLHASE